MADFKEKREILSLDIYPLQYTPNPKSVFEGSLEHGKKFYEYSMLERSYFIDNKGLMIRYRVENGCLVVVKENADERIMIDLGILRR